MEIQLDFKLDYNCSLILYHMSYIYIFLISRWVNVMQKTEKDRVKLIYIFMT